MSRHCDQLMSEPIPLLREIDVLAQLRDGPPQPNYHVEDLLIEKNYVIVSGPEAGLKTMMALDLGICLATGQDFLGLEVQGGQRIMVVEAEGSWQIAPRIGMLCAGRKLKPTDVMKNMICYEPPTDLQLDRDEQAKVVTRMAKEWGANWIIFDSFVSIHGKSEIDAGEMRQLAKTLFMPLRDAGIGVIVLDHTPLCDKTRPRGSSDKLAACDMHLNIKRHFTAAGTVGELWVKKCRHAKARIRPLWMRLDDIVKGESYHFVEAEPVKRKSGKKEREGENECYDLAVEMKGANPKVRRCDILRVVEEKEIASESTFNRAWKRWKEEQQSPQLAEVVP
jgi:hypothetical protein